MTKARMVTAIASVTAILLVGPAFSQTSNLASDAGFSSTITMLESWIKHHMEYHRIPGVSVGIVYDQELVYKKGFGYSDVEKQTPTSAATIYRIASITKTFTATAIMQLRDQGKLELDDPVRRHLPWFDIKNHFPDAPEITIWNLLTHTSGLPREAAFPYWTDNVFPTREQIVETLPEQETIYPPEHRFKYSNLALALAGEAVAAVSGQSYEQYVEDNILVPLGMTSTSVFPSDSDKARMVTPYSRVFPDGSRRRQPFTDSRGIAAAANMSSTVEDLARYISFQFHTDSTDTNTVLKLSTLREMHRVHWLHEDWSFGRGLGFSVARWDDKTVVGHGGWVVGNTTRIAFVPKDKIGVIVLTNADDGRPKYVAQRILKHISPAILKATAAEPAPLEPDTAWENYLGSYSDSLFLWVTEVMVLENKLVLYDHWSPPEDDPKSMIIELTPVAENTFRMTGDNGNGELVIFELDDNKQVTRMKVGVNYAYPVRP